MRCRKYAGFSATLPLTRMHFRAHAVRECHKGPLRGNIQRSGLCPLELENEPGLVSEITLIVVAGGEVINEARQKIIGFDRPDS